MVQYRMVVATSAWPANRCTMGTGTPRWMSRVIADLSLLDPGGGSDRGDHGPTPLAGTPMWNGSSPVRRSPGSSPRRLLDPVTLGCGSEEERLDAVRADPPLSRRPREDGEPAVLR